MSDEIADLSAFARTRAGGRDGERSKTGVPSPRVHWWTRVLLPGSLLLATAGLWGFAAWDLLWPATEVRVVPVLMRTDLESQPAGSVVVQAPGWVEADPFPTAVSALADGVVDEVLVLEGDRVERGQLVARLVDEDARIALAHADAILAERQAELAVARAALEEARQNWEHPIELTRRLQVAEAQLAEKQAELERWPSELRRAEARAVYLEAEYQRLAPLHEHEQASDIELIAARQANQAQQAEVEVVRRQRPILEAQIKGLEVEVRAAREDLRLRIADRRALAEAEAAMQRAEAAVASARAQRQDSTLRLERMAVRSTGSGVVMRRLVEPGSKLMLNTDDPRSAQVVRLYDPGRLQVRVDIPLADSAKVGVGQSAEVIVDALPERVFRGRVTRVVHEADVQKNTLQVKVAIEQPAPEIKPEMLARGRFLAATDETSPAGDEATTRRLLVPKAAVFERDGQSFVWLADQVEEVARLRPVALHRPGPDDWVTVAAGLEAGDRVIVDAPPDLADGQRIRLIED
jgi:HlyD family secretion protein